MLEVCNTAYYHYTADSLEELPIGKNCGCTAYIKSTQRLYIYLGEELGWNEIHLKDREPD